jgi:hypothetical protein
MTEGADIRQVSALSSAGSAGGDAIEDGETGLGLQFILRGGSRMGKPLASLRGWSKHLHA